MRKMRIFTCLVVVMLCVTAFSMPAFAYADDVDQEIVPEAPEIEETTGGAPLTPDGNLTLIDDIVQPEDPDGDEVQQKQFITLQSKNGNYFYLVIDRDGDTENVYFMNLVDEADLMALIEEAETEEAPAACSCAEKCVVGAINTGCEICRTNMSECVGVEAEPEPDAEEPAEDEKSGGILPVIVLLLVLGGGGAVYWFKFRKPKADTTGSDDLDDYDYGQEDEDEDTEIDDADLMAETENDEDEERE